MHNIAADEVSPRGLIVWRTLFFFPPLFLLSDLVILTRIVRRHCAVINLQTVPAPCVFCNEIF